MWEKKTMVSRPTPAWRCVFGVYFQPKCAIARKTVTSNLFLQGMLWCDMFCKSYREQAGALWLSLYCMKCNCHVIALLYHCVSDSRSSNSWQDDNDATMEIKVSSRWQWRSWWCFGDEEQRHKMMMAISCHIFWLHVMFIFYASYFA